MKVHFAAAPGSQRTFCGRVDPSAVRASLKDPRTRRSVSCAMCRKCAGFKNQKMRFDRVHRRKDRVVTVKSIPAHVRELRNARRRLTRSWRQRNPHYQAGYQAGFKAGLRAAARRKK